MADREQEQPEEEAKILIGIFKDLMKGKSIEVRCPAHKTLFCKIIVDTQYIEFKCNKCTNKWKALSKNCDIGVYHRFNKKGRLMETVIVEKGNERLLEKYEEK